MVNFFISKKMKRISSIPPSIDDINSSNKILFSIFTRYGDTVIALEIIKEFIKCYPQKEYLILCPKQMQPYVEELLPSIQCISLNKRNVFELAKVIIYLKRRVFDIGFNPWSNGLDSCYFISHCNKFLFYKDFNQPRNINHYQVIRNYLNLPEKKWQIIDLTLKDNYPNILICPQSTDNKRNLSSEHLDGLIFDMNKKYNKPEIVIASMNKSYFRDGCKKFKFKKSSDSSKQFLNLMRQSSLILCADSGPLHIALALKKDLKAIFVSTEPEIVINTGSSLVVKKS